MVAQLFVQPLQVLIDSLLHRHELVVAAGGAQRAHVGLGETLVAAFQIIRERDVFNFSFAVEFDDRVGYLVERLAPAGA